MAASSEEKGLLGSTNKPHRRYGSTSVNMKRPENIIKHRVSKQDTLQGIALRYGVTMETLKQHNKLWSIEAMFTHDYLEVPVSRDVYEAVMGTTLSPQSPTTHFNGSDRSSDASSSPSSTPKSRSPSVLSGLHDCSETNPSDFLSKIDSNIALMKSSIERMETHAYPMIDRMEVDESNCTSNNRRSYHSKVREGIYQNGFHDPTAAPHPVVTPGRTITMSLKRLLREHEELYEL
ncbi:lysM and putative peptidoglycan-binding domain-containing protein 2-like [Macrobrachium rosenbergii]|uniref:lysM and putative peptidoglycan-binding domain-containing protein 2-like n=1 Tax=Macrobrachium nipponense TaxID=159736 RepID=UPI0030C8910C